MQLIFLGTGTSTGVPQIGCNCEVCCSDDPHDKRLRSSVIVKTRNLTLLIDCGPDFRQQILGVGSPKIDALLVTHTHYDHLGGIDDLRPYCYRDGGFPVYCREEIIRDIHTRMPYCFGPGRYPGAPAYNLKKISDSPFSIGDVEVVPLPVMHGPSYRITGFRIGTLSYITDCKSMPAETLELIKDSEILVINALRFEPHPSHQTLDEALEIISHAGAQTAYLTHFSHQIGLHAVTSKKLPANVFMAYDGLSVTISD